MYILVDTETSGKPLDYKAPPSDFNAWGTARMVQLAWIEYDENGKKLSAHDYLIKPDGFHIPMDAIEVHGITNERAHEKGIPVKQVLDLFREALSRHPYMVAHNVDFDKNVIGSEFLRTGDDNPVDAVFTVCTMKSTVNFVQAKGFGGRYKWPKLSELHMKLFNTKFDGAHDALVDTEALGRCFFKLQELGILGFKTAPEKRKLFGKDKTAELPKEELFKPLVTFGVHTFYSLLRGGSSVDDYVKRAKDFGHKALVLTDRGNVSGSFEFYQKCKKAGIKPIIGCEFMLNNNIGLFENPVDEGGSYVQKIIIKNKAGYSNLNKLLFLSHSKGFRSGESRITTDWLIENKEGLMVSTSGHEGYVADLLEKGKRTEAKAHILRLKEAFGDDLFVEIKFSELAEQKALNEFLLVMAAEYRITTIMDNDVHYALPNGNELQDTVYAMSQNGAALSKARLFDRRSLFMPNRRNYIEFNKNFGYHYPEKAIEKFMDNSLLLAERCNFEFEIGVEKYPAYEPTQDVIDFFKTSDPTEIIYKMSHAKLKKKLTEREKRSGIIMSEEDRKKYFDRLEYELGVIKSKKMLDYFMINWEVLREYRSKGYEVGAGRGSAAGSLLSWVLDITKIDPLKFGLYFERFLNPTRNCLTEDSVVLMKDESLKPIGKVVAGDAVETESGKGELVQVHVRDITDEDEVFELEMENGTVLRLTGDHVMPVRRDGQRVDIRVEELQEGDEMWVS
jgi:DNA polymerase-3 subunit alpha